MNDRREGELFDIKFEVNPDFIERYNYNEASKKSLRIFFQFQAFDNSSARLFSSL